MACAQLYRVGSTGEVEFILLRTDSVELLTHFVDTRLRLLTQLVECLTKFFLFLFRHLAKLVKQFGYLSLFAKIFDT